MLKESQLREGDTFYYALETFNNHIKEFIVMAYEFHRKWHHCFDESRMFAKEDDAKAHAEKLNKHLREKIEEAMAEADL